MLDFICAAPLPGQLREEGSCREPVVSANAEELRGNPLPTLSPAVKMEGARAGFHADFPCGAEHLCEPPCSWPQPGSRNTTQQHTRNPNCLVRAWFGQAVVTADERVLNSLRGGNVNPEQCVTVMEDWLVQFGDHARCRFPCLPPVMMRGVWTGSTIIAGGLKPDSRVAVRLRERMTVSTILSFVQQMAIEPCAFHQAQCEPNPNPNPNPN